MMRQIAQVVLFLGVFSPFSEAVNAGVLSAFNSNDEGWRVVSFGDPALNDFSILGTTTPTFNAIGGNPGGYISTTDPDTGAFTFSAPSAFLGNKSGATGLSYDLIHPVGAIDYQTADLILEGNGTRLLWQRSPEIVPGSNWTSIAVSFTPSADWHVTTSTGSLATAADFANVLGNLTGLFIRGEYTNGLAETAGLDNVNLAVPSGVVPEPSSVLIAVGLGLFTIVRRQRRA